jgi:hypothetical protein
MSLAGLPPNFFQALETLNFLHHTPVMLDRSTVTPQMGRLPLMILLANTVLVCNSIFHPCHVCLIIRSRFPLYLASGSVDSLGGDFLQQVLAYLSDVDQGATAENSRLSGFPPSDIPVSRGITPSFPSVFAPAVPRDVVQAQLELQHPPPSVESLSFAALCVIPRRSGTLSHGL